MKKSIIETTSDPTTELASKAGSWNLPRRDFLKIVGGGIVILFTVGGWPFPTAEGQRRPYPSDPNAYLRIDENGNVTVLSGKIEMGQGVVTSLAQMAAEELGVALDSIQMIMGDTDQCPWDMGTFGSMSTRFFGPPLRAAAAEAKAVLLSLAAGQLGVPEGKLQVKNGVVSVAGRPGKSVSYGELAKGHPLATTLKGKPSPTSAADFQVMGKAELRRDAVEKVTGKAQYAGDIRRPGMLCAEILRPPAHGATLKSVDTAAAERMPGVRVVRQGDLIAALHADPEQAEKALKSFQPQWEVPKPQVDETTIHDHLIKTAPPADEHDARGDLAQGEKDAKALVKQRYLDAYVAHSPMETHTAMASLEDGKLTVWASTQTPFPTRDRIARMLNLKPEEVRVITPFVGGGFGGKSAGQQADEAARLAMLTKRPVQVLWSRAEEFFYDTFRPAAVVDIRSGVDASGKICLWDYTVYAAGARSTEQYYDVPNNSIKVHGEWMGSSADSHPFAVGPWRAPGANTNTFARESQIAIMAARAGIDPLQFRLDNTSDPRMQRVLKTAAQRFGWKPAAAPSHRGWGIACGIDAGTYVALMAEVEVDRQTGIVNVRRLVCAQDMGIVVNPEGATIQMEGCLTMGLGYALSEEIHFEGGKILDLNFDSYEIPRFSVLPEIETVLVKNDEVDPQGGGEPAIIGMGAAIANGIYDAVGARVLQMPMTPERVRAALQSG